MQEKNVNELTTEEKAKVFDFILDQARVRLQGIGEHRGEPLRDTVTLPVDSYLHALTGMMYAGQCYLRIIALIDELLVESEQFETQILSDINKYFSK